MRVRHRNLAVVAVLLTCIVVACALFNAYEWAFGVPSPSNSEWAIMHPAYEQAIDELSRTGTTEINTELERTGVSHVERKGDGWLFTNQEPHNLFGDATGIAYLPTGPQVKPTDALTFEHIEGPWYAWRYFA